jgi:Tfp pilus assembly pilus retraction ATPase PilT
MDVLDEISLLRQTIAQFGAEGAMFKQQYATLAFIDEWRDREALTTLVAAATTDEIVSLISEFPQMEERIIDVCSPMIQTIVREDLAGSTFKQRVARREQLTSLAAKLKELVEEERISIENLFVQESDNVIAFAA